jgi:ADP-heptose:LPS heptosyltransferase
MQTLIYHAGALGDFITTFPALLHRRRSRPGGRTVLFGKPIYGDLARAAGLIDEVRDVTAARYAPLFADGPPAAALYELREFTQAVAFASPASPLVLNLRKAGIADVRAHDPFPAERIPASLYHLRWLAGNPDLPATEAVPAIRLQDSPSGHKQRRIALHPGSGSAIKNWPIHNFVHLAQRLKSDGFSLLWIAGPAEGRADSPADAELLRDIPLVDLAHELAACSLYIGNDSGITHLAAAVGIPVIAIFGPSDARIWAPQGAHVEVVKRNFPCAPCHPGGKTQCDRQCIEAITVKEVYSACGRLA